jgi:RNA polymerase sigma factor (sigma-70 family)
MSRILNRIFDQLTDVRSEADRPLLDRFLGARDEAAFAELVRRYGPVVWGVCRRRLAHRQDAEDAFQATFLVLLRRAAHLRGDAPLGPWLYQVAVLTARNLSRGNRRRTVVAAPLECEVPGPAGEPSADGLDLDTALLALPERDRVAVVLCHLQGLTRREAAERLGCPEGTLSARLTRAMRRLRARFGDGTTAGLAAAAVTVPVHLASATVRVATVFATSELTAAGVSPAVVGLTDGVLRVLRVKRTMAAVALVVLTVGAAVAVGVIGRASAVARADEPNEVQRPPRSPAELQGREEQGEEPKGEKPNAGEKGKEDGSGGATDPNEEWTYTVTRKGKPVAGVRVGFATYDYTEPRNPKTGAFTFATSDHTGEARLKATGSPPGVHALARDPDGRGGYGSLHNGTRYPATLELHDNTELTGRILDTSEKPIPGLALKPVALGPESFARYGGQFVTVAETPDWFWTKFPPKLAADGSFTVPDVPAGHSVGVLFESPGFGSGQLWVLPGTPTTVKLQKSGSIRVKFIAPEGTKPGVVRLSARRTTTADLIESTRHAEAKDGSATLTGLPPGEYELSFPYQRADHYPRAVPPVTVKSGETSELTVMLEPAAKVVAKLVDSKMGKGIPGAKLYVTVVGANPRFSSPAPPVATADADGRIELPVPAGMVQATPQSITGYAALPIGGSNPFNQSSTEPFPVAPGKTHDFGTFTFAKTVELKGVVLGDDDKPVAGAEVRVGYSGSNFGKVSGRTDAEGRFTVRELNPEGGIVGLTAGKGDAVTIAPVAVDPGKPEGEPRLVISAKHAARVKVRAVDRAGLPIEGAEVMLMHSVRYLALGGGIIGTGSGAKVGATGADGWFASAALQPGDRYTATVTAPDRGSVTTEEWLAGPGATHDFGAVVLIRGDMTVGGRVTDGAGRPVAGAVVFDQADGPKPTETRTGADGRFMLTGLYEGPVFVSVRADGFRFTSVATESGGKPVAVVLRRETDPPAPAPTVSDAQRAATEKLARHLLGALWQNRVAANDNGRSTLRAMARLDVATARKWRDEEKARTGGKVDLMTDLEAVAREDNLLATAKGDADEAVALLKSRTGIDGFRAVCDLCGELLPVAPEQALRVAEEAVVRARGIEQAERTWALAQAGELVYRAGKPAVGRKLIEEAAKLAEPLGTAELDGYRRGMVASRVALYDPAACRKIIDPIKDAREFNRHLAQACVRAAEHDLATAKKWFGEFRPDNSFSKPTARQLVAYRLARTKPDEAIEIARGIEDRTVRATTLAGLALRLKDRARAEKLFHPVMDEILLEPNGYYNGGGGGTSAIVLFRAKQFGHPDLAGLRDKVLAARAPRISNYGPDAEYQFALALGLTDPDTARPILARALPESARAKREGLPQREALVALVVCDPDGAKAAVDGLLARVVAAKKGYDHTGLDTLAALLSRPDRLAETALGSGRLLSDFGEE